MEKPCPPSVHDHGPGHQSHSIVSRQGLAASDLAYRAFWRLQSAAAQATPVGRLPQTRANFQGFENMLPLDWSTEYLGVRPPNLWLAP